MTKHGRISYSVAASVAAALTLAMAGPSARADSNTVNAPDHGTRSFTLTSQKSSEIVQFDTTRALHICNQTQKTDTSNLAPPGIPSEPATDRPIPIQTPSPVGLQLSYSGQTTEVAPGDCATVTAQQLTVSTLQPLEGDAVLQGTVTSTAIEVPVRGERIGKVTPESIRATLADIRHMLEQDDATERATTAEFDQARDALNAAATKLGPPAVASTAQ
jgi:hypothetical protein